MIFRGALRVSKGYQTLWRVSSATSWGAPRSGLQNRHSARAQLGARQKEKPLKSLPRQLPHLGEHILNKNPIPHRRVIDEDVGNGPDRLAVLHNGTAGHECGQ